MKSATYGKGKVEMEVMEVDDEMAPEPTTAHLRQYLR